ncbi:hypothetical protein [Sphingobium cupriresistens]|uniref:Uncharacterized protein n=1 Tax=Sphingobium cupriresistens LL01 TaxID=1420583 RepID=A0A0J8AWZ1_9SPHN|nr:hypothetical protein [Sphingobium cupriresistens]KMS58695.1 hypothetical protein V473_02605 [Sphingobium cupriresistens LL01]
MKIATPEQAEMADIVVCCRKGEPTQFTDNEEGECSWCGHAAFFRPHAPKTPPRVCGTCFLAWAGQRQ